MQILKFINIINLMIELLSYIKENTYCKITYNF